MVKKVDVIGKQAERVYVEFSHARLAGLGRAPRFLRGLIVPVGLLILWQYLVDREVYNRSQLPAPHVRGELAADMVRGTFGLLSDDR